MVRSLKLNIDAAVFGNEHCFGYIGLCIRNEHGSFIKAKTLWQPGGVPDLMGSTSRLLWIQQLDYHNMVID
ncbi:hypothetical protein HKD37_07G018357 [Glycine soja]